MKLKDRKWLVPRVDFDSGEFMLNAVMVIVSVNYDVSQMIARVEVRFSEGSYGVRKSFEYELPKESEESISAENISMFISELIPSAVEINEKR